MLTNVVLLIKWTNLPADLSVNEDNVVQGQNEFGYACCSFVLPVSTKVSREHHSEQNSILSSIRWQQRKVSCGN